MVDHDHARCTWYVTRHYAQLQGLRLVPLALCFLGSAAWRSGLLAWLPWVRGPHVRVWFFISLATALLVSIPIGGWYRRRLGAALPRATTTGPTRLTVAFVLFFILASLGWSVSHVPVAMLFLWLAFGYLGFVEQGLRRHYLAVAIGCLLIAIAPQVGVPRAARSVALDLLIGLGLIVAGVGDHIALTRIVRPAEGDSDARAA